MVGSRRLGDPGHVGQRPQAGVLPPRHHLEALGDQGAVDPGQRHHVADGSQRHQVQPLHEVGLGPAGGPRPIPAGLAQDPVEADHQQKGHPHRRQLAVRAGFVHAVGVDHGDGAGQPGLGLVVIDDDDVQAGRGGGLQGTVGAGAAIHGHDHGDAAFPESQERRLVGSVAFAQAVRDIGLAAAADGGEKTGQQGRRRGPVHVVIAEHRDAFARHDGGGEASGPLLHAPELAGIGQQGFERRVEEGVRLVHADAPRRQHPADDLGHLETLGQRHRGALVGEPGQPAPAGQRPCHAEETVRALYSAGRGNGRGVRHYAFFRPAAPRRPNRWWASM